MKIIFFVFSMVALTFLIGCDLDNSTKEEPHENQALVNAIDELQEERNYQILVSINHEYGDSDILLLFNGDLSYLKDGSFEVYYAQDGNRVTEYLVYGDRLEEQSIRRPLNERFLFFTQLNPDGFNLINESYVLSPSSFEYLDTFFASHVEDAKLISFAVTLDDESVDIIRFVLEINNQSYIATMTFSNIGTTELVLPGNQG